MEDETKKTTENKTGKTHNLVLKRFQDKKITEPYQKAATTEGTSLKSLMLLGLVIASSVISCFYVFPNRSILLMIFLCVYYRSVSVLESETFHISCSCLCHTGRHCTGTNLCP